MTKISLALFTAASSLSVSSCQDEDYGYETDTIRASVYSRNFQKMYGEIDPDQTWDFSSYNLRKLGLVGGPNSGTRAALTRAEIPDLVTKYTSGWYRVSDETTTWLNNNLQEKKNNTKYVSSFNWEKVEDSDPLYIIPVYQGQTGMIWDLELVDLVNHTSSIIWSKSENLQYTRHYAVWDEFFYESWKAEEAPNTSLKNKNGVNDNKLITLKFSKPLANVPESFNETNDIIAAFNVARDIPGSFYINIDGSQTKITKDKFGAFFTNESNKIWVTDEDAGLFCFTTDGNFVIQANRYMSSGRPNKVYLNALLDVEIDGRKITVDDLKTLQFIIDDSFVYPYGSDDKFSHDYTFNTWSPDRIRVYVKYDEGGDGETVSLKDGTNQYTEHHTINKYHVETRPIRIDINKLSGEFALNLKTKYRSENDADLSEIGDDHRSDQGFMSQINHFSDGETTLGITTLVETLEEQFSITDLADTDGNFEYMVIGCEDAGANGKSSDQDYNDLVLLVVGKTLPTQTIKKRYMIEDLGSTLDFDFNDIVVDVTEKVARTSVGGKTYTQTAAIRHLRGTIPFRISIGTEGEFGTGDNKGKIMRGHNCEDIDYDPSQVTSIKDEYTWEHTETITTETELSTLRSKYWNPDANNIRVEVWPSYNSENGKSSDVFWTGRDASSEDNFDARDYNVQYRKIVEFPKTGTVPYIIAVDPTVQWMEENISIPEYWIATHPENFNNDFEQSDDTEDSSSETDSTPEEGNKINNTSSLPAGNFALSDARTKIEASHSLTIPANAFNDVYVGDEIIIHVDGTKVYDKSRLDFRPSTDEIKKIGANGSIVVSGDYAIKVTQRLLNDLQANGLQIGGQYVTVTSVDVKSDGGAKVTGSSIIAPNIKLPISREVIRDFEDRITITSADLNKLYVDDKIIIKVANLRTGSQIGFHTKDWTLITNSADYPLTTGLGDIYSWNNYPVTGDITIDVTETSISKLKSTGGIVINGQYVTIEGVFIQPARDNNAQTVASPTKVSGGTSIYNQNKVISFYSDHVDIASSNFSDIATGDQIIIKLDNVRTNSALGIRKGGTDDLVSWFGDRTYGNIYSLNGDYVLTVTDNNISDIRNNGIRITGAYINITGVAIKKAPRTLYSGDPITLTNYGDWQYFVSEQGGASSLAGAIQDGYTNITFYFSANDGKIQFKTPKNKDGQAEETWPVLIGTEIYGHSFSNGQYTLAVTSDMITQMNGGGGLIIQEGRNQTITITKVEASKP